MEIVVAIQFRFVATGACFRLIQHDGEPAIVVVIIIIPAPAAIRVPDTSGCCCTCQRGRLRPVFSACKCSRL